MKLQYPELFLPIPLRIGQSSDNPDGWLNGSVEDWRGIDDPNNRIEIQESHEPLVCLDTLQPLIFTSSDYSRKLINSGYDVALEGSTLSQYVRAGVAKKLIKAQSLLPDGYKLIMFDGWRSLDAQIAIFNMCRESLIDRLRLAGVLHQTTPITSQQDDLITREVIRYVSLPSPLPASAHPKPEEVAAGKLIPSPHNTGGSVDVGIVVIDEDFRADLTQLEQDIAKIDDTSFAKRAELVLRIDAIYRLHSSLLDFGSEFDFAGEQSNLTYLEDTESIGRDNRRLLYHVMTKAGFEAYSEEWWHFNAGNQMAAITTWRRTGKRGQAMYGSTALTPQQLDDEQLMRDLTNALVQAAHSQPIILSQQLTQRGITLPYIQQLSLQVGDPRQVHSLPATHDMHYRGDLSPSFTDALLRASTLPLQAVGDDD